MHHPEVAGRLGANVVPDILLGGFHTAPAATCGKEVVGGGRQIPQSLIRKLRLCCDLSFPGMPPWNASLYFQCREGG